MKHEHTKGSQCTSVVTWQPRSLWINRLYHHRCGREQAIHEKQNPCRPTQNSAFVVHQREFNSDRPWSAAEFSRHAGMVRHIRSVEYRDQELELNSNYPRRVACLRKPMMLSRPTITSISKNISMCPSEPASVQSPQPSDTPQLLLELHPSSLIWIISVIHAFL